MRNIDTSAEELEGVPAEIAFSDVFPLGTPGKNLSTGCDYSKPRTKFAVSQGGAYIPHISEGIDPEAHNEFTCLSQDNDNDLVLPGTAIIHAVALNPGDAAIIRKAGAKVVWSPRSNVDLYGNTTQAVMLDMAGVTISLGTDWIPSGSMNMYTGVFLRFIHGVLDEFREAEAFLFHTRLVHVSDAMKERDAQRALDRLSMMAQGAGGGTKIGECLEIFNRWHAARVIHSRTCVMIVSDGYETGDARLLGREMAALARRCRRIAWLNPMMGWEGYQPLAAGMQAALPHIDLLAPANTLKSLGDLEPYLARL